MTRGQSSRPYLSFPDLTKTTCDMPRLLLPLAGSESSKEKARRIDEKKEMATTVARTATGLRSSGSEALGQDHGLSRLLRSCPPEPCLLPVHGD
jgi:hypothetical protein